MMWLIPRSDPGTITEYCRPHAGGVSTERGAPLPHGPYPRLVMLWMYAECAHAVEIPPQERDPITSICDFLLALDIETEQISPVFAQAQRLFACRFHAGREVMPVIAPSFLGRAGAAVPARDDASHRGMALAYGDAFRRELTARRLRPCPRTVRALRHSSFALDAYLWDLSRHACARPGATPAPSRLAQYHALADRPSRSPSLRDVLAFEHDLARVREQRQNLEAQTTFARQECPAD